MDAGFLLLFDRDAAVAEGKSAESFESYLFRIERNQRTNKGLHAR
jgi:hypothetical protein